MFLVSYFYLLGWREEVERESLFWVMFLVNFGSKILRFFIWRSIVFREKEDEKFEYKIEKRLIW